MDDVVAITDGEFIGAPGEGALAHVRVVDLGTSVGVSLGARMLGDLGAEVVKVETCDGPSLRRSDPSPLSNDPRVRLALFDYLNANKRGVDVRADQRAEMVRRLVAGADVLLEDGGPGGMEREGIGPETLRTVNATLSVVRLSDYGQTGPDVELPASDFTLQARAGWIKSRGGVGSTPVQVGGRFHEYVAATYVATAALTSVVGARRLGTGMDADVSMLECLQSTLTFPTISQTILAQLGTGTSIETLLGVKPCRDGWVGMNILTAKQWRDLCHLTGMPELADSRERLRQGGPDRDSFENQVAAWTADQTVVEVVRRCQELRLPVVPVHDGESIVRAAQWVERPFFDKVSNDDGTFVRPSYPWRFGRTPAGIARRAPRVGEHNTEVAAAPWPERQQAPPVEPDGRLPLDGVRVLDLGTFWAGAGCGSFLGAMGADVIKIESTRRPDGWRYNMASPALGERWWERGRYRAVNLSKRGLTVDLATDQGKDVFARLLESADVVLENFSARVMDSFGFGWDAIKAVNPRIVMARMPGFGLIGPWRDYVGFGPSFVHLSGHTAVTGFANEAPVGPGGYMDPLVAMAGAFAIISGLESRRVSGEGQLIEVSQIEVGACLAPEPVIAHSITGVAPERLGNMSLTVAPQNVYPTADHRWVAISVRNDTEWAAVASLAGVRRLAGVRLEERRQRHREIDDLLRNWTTSTEAKVITTSLAEIGVPAATVSAADDYLSDPQMTHRKFFEPVDHAVVGPDEYPGWPVRWNPHPDRAHRGPAPLMGQHNEEILREIGCTDGDVHELQSLGVIGTEPAGGA